MFKNTPKWFKNIVEEDVWFTDANGEVFTKGLITAGEYELVEVQPLPGFREIAPIPFTTDEGQPYVDLGELIGFRLELGEIVNYWKLGDLKIMKVGIDLIDFTSLKEAKATANKMFV